MSYLVLARKWRPRSFDTLVGQEHVVRALSHALDTQRLHHAWLFTGTRGVGKTTLSRILAKSLNCEQGVSAHPCGVCQACTEIDAGRFVDYIELDAASNRGVDEMTQLLEQAVYAPTSGRYKVYMIDEVHMLTGHSFNAMLKTLEEPPPHVKFILATTDPQKIPVTVLSRCLQFNLKQMSPESIAGHLRTVLSAEDIPFDEPALRLLAKAAQGSMRDALSLTDQAIAFSSGALSHASIQEMLGTIDQSYLIRLIDAIIQHDAHQVLAIADELSIRSLSYAGALSDLAILLAELARIKKIPTSLPADHPFAEDYLRLSQAMNADVLQLFYSIVLHSRAELALAPDEYAGFVMGCLRLLAFSEGANTSTDTVSSQTTPLVSSKPASVAPPAPTNPTPTNHAPTSVATPTLNETPRSLPVATVDTPPASFDEPVLTSSVESKPVTPVVASPRIEWTGSWPEFVSQLPLKAVAAQLAKQSELLSFENNHLILRVQSKVMAEGSASERLKAVISDALGQPIRLSIEVGVVQGETVRAQEEHESHERQQQAVNAITSDPVVQSIIKEFDGQIVPDSIRPI